MLSDTSSGLWRITELNRESVVQIERKINIDKRRLQACSTFMLTLEKLSYKMKLETVNQYGYFEQLLHSNRSLEPEIKRSI